MINPSRRSMLRMLGLSPLAASAAAQAAQEAMLVEAGIGALGSIAKEAPGVPSSDVSASRSLMLQLLSHAQTRAEMESLYYQMFRRVYFLDPDIANKRSFSLAAKVTFQRQRNVERELADATKGSPWQQCSEFLNRMAGIQPPQQGTLP